MSEDTATYTALAFVISVSAVVAGGVWKVDSSIDSALARERQHNEKVYATRVEVANIVGELRRQTDGIDGLRRELVLLRMAVEQDPRDDQ